MVGPPPAVLLECVSNGPQGQLLLSVELVNPSGKPCVQDCVCVCCWMDSAFDRRPLTQGTRS
eukprot:5835911-Lingulodinium_polyedra.AAC.1